MARKWLKPRLAWEDRFAMPEASDLLGRFHRQHSSLIQQAREGLRALGDVTESIVWRGVPWRWTFAYSDEGEQERSWAYLVPQPGRPMLAIPLTAEQVDALPMKRLSKSVRDGIMLAATVGGVYWAQWELTSRPQVDELIGIARRRRESSTAATA